MDKSVSIFLNSFESELKVACAASGIEIEDVEEEVDSFFRHIRLLLEDERLPDVALAELGTFKSTPTTIRGAIGRYKAQYNIGNISKDFYKYIISKYWYAYKRIVDYKHGKGGVINNKVGVGYFWAYVPNKFSHILFPDLYNKAVEERQNKKDEAKRRRVYK